MKTKNLLFHFMLLSSLFIYAQQNSKKDIIIEKTTIGCDYYPQFTEVYIIPGSVEHPDVKPKKLSDEEKCLVEQSRKENEFVILQLDRFTEVRIYPKSKIKE